MAPAEERPVTFRNAGQQLVGMLHLPATAGASIPGVVFFHGFTGSKAEVHRIFVRIARSLAAGGIAALRFDFRGSGDSEGEFGDALLSGELADAREAVRFLRAQERVDEHRIGLCGMSLGGLIAAHVLREDDRLRCAVLHCPLSNTMHQIAARTSFHDGRPVDFDGWLDLDGWPVNRAFIKELAASRPLEAIVRSRAPVLIIHGDADQSVPVADAYAYQEARDEAGLETALHIIQGAGHSFDALPWVDELVERSAAWFSERL